MTSFRVPSFFQAGRLVTGLRLCPASPDHRWRTITGDTERPPGWFIRAQWSFLGKVERHRRALGMVADLAVPPPWPIVAGGWALNSASRAARWGR